MWIFLLLCILGLAGVNGYFWWQSAVVAKVPKNLRPNHGYLQSTLEPTIAPRDLKFENDAIREKFLKADSAARQMARLGWSWIRLVAGSIPVCYLTCVIDSAESTYANELLKRSAAVNPSCSCVTQTSKAMSGPPAISITTTTA